MLQEKVLKNFKSRAFPVINQDKTLTPEAAPKRAPTKHKTSELILHKRFEDEKDINGEIFWNYFKNKSPLFIAKDLL